MDKSRFIKKRALDLRSSSTEAERKIWSALRNRQLGHKFRRQESIEHFIVDFVCFEKRLIIELDGGQHTPEKDAARTSALKAEGFTILCFWNNDVMENRNGVLQTIKQVLENSPSP